MKILEQLRTKKLQDLQVLQDRAGWIFKISLCVLCFCSLFMGLYAEDIAADEFIVRKVNAHLEIEDVLSACDEARQGFVLHPQSKCIQEAYIKALAHTNDDKLLWRIWKNYAKQFPDPYLNRDLLETMAWGIITTGSASSSPIIRSMALLGAFFGQDAKGVEIMCQNMRDSNSFIRSIAVKLASHMHDARLGDEVIRLFHQEKNWIVRLEVIKALGKMKLEEARPLLMNLIADNHAMAEEKSASVKSLVQLLDTAESEDINRLAGSDRAGLRLLACELIEYFDLNGEIDVLAGFLKDSNAEVRVAALHAIGVMHIAISDHSTLNVQCNKLVNDPNHSIAIMSAWLLVLNNSELGRKTFAKLLMHETPEVRQTSAAALASTGKYGLDIMQVAFKESQDPYVRMNLAIGLINQRTATEQACKTLYDGLVMVKERWMWDESGPFKVLQKSDIKHDDSIPNLPESVNQITRLEILNILSIMKFPDVQSALKTFLQHRSNSITGLASALLLTEGDEEAIKIVESLLKDQDKKIKVQAALVLAIWGGGEEVIGILEQAYDDADRATKESILEGLGSIGASSSIRFLVDKLQEPYQTLRIIAAAALLECLNH